MMEKGGISKHCTSENQMQNKQQYYERVKLLTETGKHLEAQALYEKLIGRKRIDSLIIVEMELKHM